MDENISIIIISLIFIYIFIILKFSSSYRTPVKHHSFSVLGLLLTIVFCLYPMYDGDYFSYMNIYDDLLGGKARHLEEVYGEIAQFSSNYTSFRFIVWGTALIFFFLFVKRMNLNPNLCFFFLCSMFLPLFAYGRVSLGFCIVFYGISFLIKPIRSKIWSYFWGCTIIIGSLFFHKSMPLIIPVMLSVMLLRLLPKYTIIVICVCIPLLSYLFQTYIVPYMFSMVASDSTELAINTMNNYMSEDSVSFSLGYTIKKMLEYITFYFSVYIAVLFLIKNKNNKTISDSIKSIAYIIFSIAIIATLFLLNEKGNTYIFFYRQLNFMIIPIAILLAYCYTVKWKPKLVKINLYLGVLSAAYWLIYSYYASL